MVRMKLLNGINSQKLLRMLGDALQKEDDAWQPHSYSVEDSKVIVVQTPTLNISFSELRFCNTGLVYS